VSQPNPTGELPVTTAKPPARYGAIGARVRAALLYWATPSLGTRPRPADCARRNASIGPISLHGFLNWQSRPCWCRSSAKSAPFRRFGRRSAAASRSRSSLRHPPVETGSMIGDLLADCAWRARESRATLAPESSDRQVYRRRWRPVWAQNTRWSHYGEKIRWYYRWIPMLPPATQHCRIRL